MLCFFWESTGGALGEGPIGGESLGVGVGAGDATHHFNLTWFLLLPWLAVGLLPAVQNWLLGFMAIGSCAGLRLPQDAQICGWVS